ncbi:hypothetical protein [Paenibacillus soyae]|uniref:DUF3221 domain-containing protein n=1 Tax=Paenibacillus soyae TaxID=2969249 RepID=A0A9X2MY25_9BACL|nr:hypothetical protein [Paenibacillus soyae]MCR2807993.1 hypothetical protein [Paenibacillus soyae]
MSKKTALLILLAICMMLAACTRPYGHYKDDEMVGTISSINAQSRGIEVDISEWTKRDVRGGVNDYGVSILIEQMEDLAIRHEDGSEADFADLKVGQKVLVNPPRRDKQAAYQAEEVILLEMTYEEKYDSLLSPGKSRYETTVMSGKDNELTPEMREQLMGLLTSTNTNMSFGDVFPEHHIVDFEKELGIERYPVMLVFDHKQMLLKTYDVEELAEFLKGAQ